MIHYIIEGDIYIANMTQHLRVKSEKEPYEVFQKLRAINPSPFGGYLNYGQFQIVCASPERFLQMKSGHVETRPIKGTRKRGSTEEEDQAMKAELENSEKDKSELLMIVDLERNDLNRVCKQMCIRDRIKADIIAVCIGITAQFIFFFLTQIVIPAYCCIIVMCSRITDTVCMSKLVWMIVALTKTLKSEL